MNFNFILLIFFIIYLFSVLFSSIQLCSVHFGLNFLLNQLMYGLNVVHTQSSFYEACLDLAYYDFYVYLYFIVYCFLIPNNGRMCFDLTRINIGYLSVLISEYVVDIHEELVQVST